MNFLSKNFLRSLEKSSFNDAFLARVLYVPSLILLSAENVPSGGWDDTIKEITLCIIILYEGDGDIIVVCAVFLC